jgi:PhnB protein
MIIEKTFFAPHLAIKDVNAAVGFYKRAFGAIVLRSWANPDGSLHVAEMEIDGAMFHLHEETPTSGRLGAESLNGTSVMIGLFTSHPDRLIEQAADTGGVILDAMKDYEYGYRQGILKDPFGHQWLIQKRI